jgi:hypothetical protein
MSQFPGRNFVPGWSPEYARRARARLDSGLVRVLTVGRFRGAVPPAWYNPPYRYMAQGQAGMCHAHAAVASAEDTAKNALGLTPFPIARHFIGWLAKQLFEGGGNPSDGADPADDLMALLHARGGGAPREGLDPYTDDYRYLGMRPAEAAFEDAKRVGFDALVEAKNDEDAIALIASGHTLANGINWPANFDPTTPQTFFDQAGPIVGGHALAECGYLLPGVRDGRAWIALRNWHGQLYPALPAELAAKVPNYPYQPAELTPDLWVEAGLLNGLRGDYVTRIAPTQVEGLAAAGFELLDMLPI